MMLTALHVLTPLLMIAAEPPISADHAEQMRRGQDLFTKEVRQLLLDSCLKCHGGLHTRGGLDISTRESLIKGGDDGSVLIAGAAQKSKLYRLAAHLEEPHMPPKTNRLTTVQLERMAKWIDLGAPYDKPLVDKKQVAKQPMVVTEEDRRFWSFQPLADVFVPPVKQAEWVKTPLDRFILSKLEAHQLHPNEAIDRRRLIRRVTFDLTGLPPTPEEISNFVNDKNPTAYEQLLDRLLASPRYGERWGRHWLDLARFAESHGYEQDYDRPYAYYYRDFVIKAFNMDMPYDRFVQWQIAGDELEPSKPLALMATGFLAAGVHSTQITASQVEKERYDELDDMLRTIGTSMLGLTIGCARCHDHKYDPIPMRDYYRMLATFTTTVRSELPMDLDPEQTARALSKYEPEHKRLTSALAKYEQHQLPQSRKRWLADTHTVLELLQPAAAGALDAVAAEAAVFAKGYQTFDATWMQLNKAVEDHAKQAPQLPKVLVCSEGLPAIRLHTQGGDFLPETYFLKRGDPNQKDGVVDQSFLQVLMRDGQNEKHWQKPPPAGWRTSYRRRALAAWITDTQNGAGNLLARVIVNRLWQHHFGRGLVATPSDFGMQGERPTHPELLDYLARQLISGGWHLKPLHKLIMRSAAYMQSNDADSARSAVDIDNKWLWRQVPRRLEAEAIRDAMLAASGLLDERMYGPGTLDPQMKRRSIYFFIKRSQLIPSMVVFDGPDVLQSCERRVTTTVAPQALLLMNSQSVRRCAEALAQKIAQDGKQSPENRMRQAYRLTLGRDPTAAECEKAQRFLSDQASDGRAWADFCQVLFGLNEFAYVD